MGIGEQQNLGQRTEGSKIWDGRFKERTIAQNDQLARYLSVSERAGNDAPPIKGGQLDRLVDGRPRVRLSSTSERTHRAHMPRC